MLIIFQNLRHELRSTLLSRAIAVGITALPRRDFQHAGRILLAFEVPHG